VCDDHPLCKMSSNVLRMVLSTPAGHSADGKPVFLRDIWPSKDEIQVSPVSTLTVMATRMVLVSLSLSLFCSPQFIFLHYWSSFIASPITILSCRTLIFPIPVKPNLHLKQSQSSPLPEHQLSTLPS